jgi:hypothetical protein
VFVWADRVVEIIVCLVLAVLLSCHLLCFRRHDVFACLDKADNFKDSIRRQFVYKALRFQQNDEILLSVAGHGCPERVRGMEPQAPALGCLPGA